VVDAAYDAIITIDQEHKITLFDRAAEYLFGYSQSEMIGQPLSRLIPERFRERHSDLLQKEAETDELTGLPNRRTFLDTAADLFRSSEQVSLFMLDVDHFKKVNEWCPVHVWCRRCPHPHSCAHALRPGY
jgi:GGDEF domain-containing protein